MPTYQSPGVYIEEVPSGPQPIAAASTSVVAILGSTRKGPLLTPTRVTGWSDFVRTFGAAHSRGFTAESVFGFFENGGPAAWVVRVDPSTTASWTVVDSAGATSFGIAATSAGQWGNDLAITVAPDTAGGSGAMFRTAVRTAASIVGTTATAVPVESTLGVRAGDAVVLVSPAAATNATVTAVGAGTITVQKTGAGTVDLAVGDLVAGRADSGATTLTLAAGNGIRVGDLLVAQLADGSRVTSTVSAVAAAGTGLVVTLAAGLGSGVPGAAFARRMATFRGAITGGTTTIPLSQVVWEADPALVPINADSQMANARATVSTGAVAAFTAGAFAMPGGATAPAGAIEVEAQVRVALLTETISMANPTAGDVLGRFPYLPENTTIRLSDGTNTLDVTRTGAATATLSGDPAHTFTSATFRLPGNASRGVVVRCAVAPRVGDVVDFAGTRLAVTGVDNPGGTIYVLHFAATTDISAATIAADPGRFPLMATTPTRLFPLRFALSVATGGSVVETFGGLSLNPGHPQYYARQGVVNEVSAHITVAPRAAGAPAIAESTMPAAVNVAQGGLDVVPGTADVRAGIATLELQQEPAMVVCPDITTFTDPLLQADLVGALVTHCESFRRLAIIDAPDESDDTELLAWRNTTVSSSYAAVYAPHLTVVAIDPEATERFRTVPPSGFVAGVFARTDRERGVHKAPGNERVRGIVGLAQAYTQRRQDLLNPASVNLIRAFPGRGTRIWGARTATDDVTWRYVNVRRLFNAIELSVEQGTQWVVFEPNTASTWIRIKVSLENFLDQQWRAGALAGTKPEQAYRVRVGLGETMTETDIDLGLVITEVAIAPAKPAEFVVFRFSHKRLSE